MRDSKRKACPDVAASRQAAGMEAADKAAPYTRSNCTTSAAGRQQRAYTAHERPGVKYGAAQSSQKL